MTDSPAKPAVATAPEPRRLPPRKLAYALSGVGGLVLLLLYVEGAFHGGKIEPGNLPIDGTAVATGAVRVVRREVEDVLEWPGTLRARSEARLSSKLMARVLEVRVEVGSSVKAGDVVATLDDREILSRLGQAKAALESAEARGVQSDAEFARVKGLFEKEAATRRDFEAAQARAASARALVEQARQTVAEAEILLTETAVRAPFDGVVTEKAAQAGDTALPGRPILTLQDPRRLRLEAAVPESCARKASLGLEVRVRIDAPARELSGRIDEIAPVADPQSGTFLLKASLPADDALRPGMFGRFLQSCGTKAALLVPATAVVRVGQIESVRVREAGQIRIRHVRAGKSYGDQIEILSGLREGEEVLAP